MRSFNFCYLAESFLYNPHDNLLTMSYEFKKISLSIFTTSFLLFGIMQLVGWLMWMKFLWIFTNSCMNVKFWVSSEDTFYFSNFQIIEKIFFVTLSWRFSVNWTRNLQDFSNLKLNNMNNLGNIFVRYY